MQASLDGPAAATGLDRAPGSLSIAPRTAQAATHVKLSLSTHRVRPGHRAKASVSVTSARGAVAGTVRVVTARAGHRWTVTRQVRNGHVTLRLPKLTTPGVYRVRAKFAGTTTLAPRASKRTALRVTRAVQQRSSSSCAAPRFPNAGCTGVPAGTHLTPYRGSSTISRANTVIVGKTLGCITVSAPGVVIRKSRIECSNPVPYVVTVDDGSFTGTPLLLENVEVDCKNGPGTAIGEASVTVRRANIHGCENGFDMNQRITVEDSFIHDLWNSGDSHTDGIQFGRSHLVRGSWVNGGYDLTIRHNTIFGVGYDGTLGTSAIISNRDGSDTNVLVQGNLLAGGAYTLYCPGGKGSNYRVVGNHFSKRFSSRFGAYGASDGCSNETLSGNVVQETRAALHLD